MTLYLHITYAHPPVCFQSREDYLYPVQCKCCVNSYYVVLRDSWQEKSLYMFSTGTVFFLNIFSIHGCLNLWWVKTVDGKPVDTESVDTEGQLYLGSSTKITKWLLCSLWASPQHCKVSTKITPFYRWSTWSNLPKCIKQVLQLSIYCPQMQWLIGHSTAYLFMTLQFGGIGAAGSLLLPTQYWVVVSR
jgi:hypothetical protein